MLVVKYLPVIMKLYCDIQNQLKWDLNRVFLSDPVSVDHSYRQGDLIALHLFYFLLTDSQIF